MVKELHAADIEVIPRRRLQTNGRGQPHGPTLAYRPPRQQQLLPPRQRRTSRTTNDTTGTGNSLLMRSPHVLQLIMDSLRYWVTEMHVDGFRFDLAATLARQFHEVDKLSAFFDLIQQDPVVSQVKLIAEPWGRRRGWLPGRQLPAAVDRVERQVPRHSARLLARRGRRPRRVRFSLFPDPATSTSTPAASRSRRSTSSPPTTVSRCATSCPTTRSTTRPTARATRRREPQQLVVETAASRARRTIPGSGTCGCVSSATSSPPCSSRRGADDAHGDELGRTQGGNNNGYCQDNDISWIQWILDEDDQKLLAFTQSLVKLRREHPRLPTPSVLRG